MDTTETPLAGVYVVTTTPFVDDRGEFARWYCKKELSAIVGDREIVNVNFSETQQVGVVRGLHYQIAPYGEMKCVRCLHGSVFDVCVDLRKESPTFLQWFGIELSDRENKMLVIPEGCAHGFQTLESNSRLLYLMTQYYVPTAGRTIRFDDRTIDIKWPLPVSYVSATDRNAATVGEAFEGVEKERVRRIANPSYE